MRATALIGMAPGLDPNLYDHSEIEKYGVGKGQYCLSRLFLDDLI
jgi:hypothetical protein